ncbi:hypothetical protein G9Q84_19790 [Pseudomonas sp. P7]|uniref:Lipoprotein n=1 Tax=Pseudomonas sivasensis TaxID=1880678 RepID=A0ABW8DT54_9PSED|nr:MULTISPECIES: hypothetical protein [Pseudomonas]MBA2925125.1 hypothetical protein [Pseudomonas sivasensis]OYT82152.1 MAG: hypothetical protein CFE48_02345 [Pseudomonas sp. PGPPP2]
MRNTWLLLFSSSIALAGCGGFPSVPYVDPPQADNTARVRVITNSNVFGDSVTGSCAPDTRHKMAEAGRFSEEGQPSINYPRYPLKPASLGMPGRVSPKLQQYIGSVRMAEGLYTEIVAEYRVKTDAPFQIATLGASAGSYGSTYAVCPGQAKVFTLEPGKDYEALVGLSSAPNADGNAVLMCMFGVVELTSIPNLPFALPKRLAGTESPQTRCKD